MRIRAPVDVATRTRFRAVRRDVDAHDGRVWQVRLELDLDDSSLVEIAEDLLTSDDLGAQVVTGKGSVVRLTTEQVSWLHHKLSVLLSRDQAGRRHEEPEQPVALDPAWLTSTQAAARLGVSYQVFLRRARTRDVAPVHRVGSVLYWSAEQVQVLGGRLVQSGNRSASRGVQ